MSEKQHKMINIIKLIFKNAFQFLFTLAFILIFQSLFGTSNILLGVSISVGLTMFPNCPLGIRPFPFCITIIGFYIGSVFVSQLALSSPWIALPINFLFVTLIMLFLNEPMVMKPSISFLLAFVFCQASPVSWNEFHFRFWGAALGGILVAVITVVQWKKKGYDKDGRTLKEQVLLCQKNHSYILRMAIGISVAMLIGMLLKLKKPLWISIVVMSLTQLEFQETLERIKHRTFATAVAALVFMLVFRTFIPDEYSIFFIMLLGYLNFFMPEYKHKQIVNAISALDASMVLLDTTTAIGNRFSCLFGGIVIVLFLHFAQMFIKTHQKSIQQFFIHLRNIYSKKNIV